MVVVKVLKMVKVATIAIVAEIVCFHKRVMLPLAIFVGYVAADPVLVLALGFHQLQRFEVRL